MKQYRFGPVILGFQGFPEYADYPFRDWKLDAYRVQEGQPELVISYTPQTVSPQGTLLQEQRFMTGRRQLWLENGYFLWQQTQNDGSLLQYKITPRDITVLADSTNTLGLAALESLTFFLFDILLRYNILSFHSCLVEHEGKGILLCGPSGVGKTTHARLWRDHKNALILNSDRGCCYMRQGQWTAFGTPWCGTGGEHINRQVPIKALVLLEQAEYNRVTPLTSEQMLRGVMPLVCAGLDGQGREKMLTLLDEFIREIPVLRLECTPDAAAVDTLCAYLEN